MLSSSTQAALDNPYGHSKKAGEDLLFAYGRETGAGTLIYRGLYLSKNWRTSCEVHLARKEGGGRRMSKKEIVLYYTWAGHTRAMAEIIAAQTGADRKEILPKAPYSADYNTVVKQAKKEIRGQIAKAGREQGDFAQKPPDIQGGFWVEAYASLSLGDGLRSTATGVCSS